MLNTIGSIASIIGTLVAFGTIIYAICIDKKLTNFSKKVLFNTRVTPLKKDFDKNISNLNQLFNDYTNQKPAIIAELNLILANIRSITPKLPNQIIEEFKGLDKRISSILKGQLVETIDYGNKNRIKKLFSQSQFDLNNLWAVYGNLSYYSKVLDNLIKDKKIT